MKLFISTLPFLCIINYRDDETTPCQSLPAHKLDPAFICGHIHHPDGTPDILQQIEHGTLALIAQHRAFGRAIAGIIVPNLHQYHHLGDGSTMTDNLPYNPKLKPYESDGVSSGTPDDRWKHHRIRKV